MIFISTKKGDDGKTALIGQKRLSKDSQVFSVLGDIDELNSHIGLIITYAKSRNLRKHKIIVNELLDIQSKLFTLSAQIAGSDKVEIFQKDLKKIERRSKSIQQSLSDNWHNKFLFPGGNRLAAYTDIARAVCRRVERNIVSYNKIVDLPPLILKYINRLSDYLYLIRCQFNDLDQVEETEFN